jgi:hypothetical protein
MAKPTPQHGLARVEFNRQAKQLRADGSDGALRALKDLAVAKVFPMPGKGHPSFELWQSLATAAMGAAVDWWTNGGKLPHDRVRKAISTAARKWRAEGRGVVSVTWRGPIDKHTRNSASAIEFNLNDNPEFRELAERFTVGIAGALGESADEHEIEASEPTESDASGEDLKQRTLEQRTEYEQHSAQRKEREKETEKTGEDPNAATVATGAGVASGAAERTDNDGGHADGERLNPRDDGETAHGVDGATRGVGTGSLIPHPWWIARQVALAAQSEQDQAFMESVRRAGSIDNYVKKNKRTEARYRADYARLNGQVNRDATALRERHGDLGVQVAWVQNVPRDPGHKTVIDKRTGEYTGVPAELAPRPGMEPWDVRGWLAVQAAKAELSKAMGRAKPSRSKKLDEEHYGKPPKPVELPGWGPGANAPPRTEWERWFLESQWREGEVPRFGIFQPDIYAMRDYGQRFRAVRAWNLWLARSRAMCDVWVTHGPVVRLPAAAQVSLWDLVDDADV